MSTDIETDINNPVSYYNINDGDACPNMRQYLEDIQRLSSRPDSWVIPMAFCTGPASREHKVHLCYNPVKHDAGFNNAGCTVKDSELFDSFANEFADVMEKNFGLKTDRNEFYVVGKTNVLHHIPCENGFALRLECAPFYFSEDKVAKIKAIADVLNRHFEPGVEKLLPPEMVTRPKDCFGFEDYID